VLYLVIPSVRWSDSQVIHTTMVTQATHPPSQTLQMSTPYIGGQSSMGGQPLAGGKPSAGGKFLGGNLQPWGKPMWLQHQQAWGKATPASPSIPTTTGLYPGQPYPGVSNPLWGQPNPGHSSARNFSLSICKPHDSNTTIPLKHSIW
jgi:hypothetical protein